MAWTITYHNRSVEDFVIGLPDGEIMKHADLKKKALQRPGVKTEYEALSSEFELLRQMLSARTKAGMTQAEVASRMGTHAPAITRMESALGSGKHSPSLDTLKRYAEAVGCDLQIKFVPSSGSKRRNSKVNPNS